MMVTTIRSPHSIPIVHVRLNVCMKHPSQASMDLVWGVVLIQPTCQQIAQKSVAKLQKASCIYEKESAAGSPEKDVTGSRKFKVVAVEVDSSQKALSHGLVLVGAPLEKRVALIVLSMRIANVPVTSSSLSARLAGNWASIFMFRRRMICLLFESYSYSATVLAVTARRPQLRFLSYQGARQRSLCSVVSSPSLRSPMSELRAVQSSMQPTHRCSEER